MLLSLLALAVLGAVSRMFVREGVARDEWRTAYVGLDDKVADMLTKPMSGPKRVKFV